MMWEGRKNIFIPISNINLNREINANGHLEARDFSQVFRLYNLCEPTNIKKYSYR